jgi:hypothetical protein
MDHLSVVLLLRKVSALRVLIHHRERQIKMAEHLSMGKVHLVIPGNEDARFVAFGKSFDELPVLLSQQFKLAIRGSVTQSATAQLLREFPVDVLIED